MNPARLAAARALVAIEHGDTTLARELERARRGVDDERDRGLLVELAAGSLRYRNAIDAILRAASERPIDGLTAPVRAILRLGVYQLWRLDRVPDHAVVSDAVESARQMNEPRAAGFVNAVLRSVIRRGRNLPLPSVPAAGASDAERLRYLTITESHPEWLAARWMARYGFEQADAWCRFNNRPPDVTLRLFGSDDRDRLLARLRDEGVDASPSRWVERAITLTAGTLGRLPPELRRTLFVQDEASQIVAHVVGARGGERVLDVCAAPGGKTLVLADTMGGQGLLIGCDYRPARVRLLRTLVQGAPTPVRIVALDGLQPLPFLPVFDRVLIDAPCSGLGTIRRDPDLRWSRRPEDLAGFAGRQLRFLEQAARAVKPGGVLVYATCSGEPDENEAVVQAFLASGHDFELRPALPGAGVADAESLVDAAGFLRTEPARHGLEAFFAALLVRRQAA